MVTSKKSVGTNITAIDLKTPRLDGSRSVDIERVLERREPPEIDPPAAKTVRRSKRVQKMTHNNPPTLRHHQRSYRRGRDLKPVSIDGCGLQLQSLRSARPQSRNSKLWSESSTTVNLAKRDRAAQEEQMSCFLWFDPVNCTSRVRKCPQCLKQRELMLIDLRNNL